jgi:hypothetical protein
LRSQTLIALQIISLTLTKPTAWLRGKDLNLRPSGYEPDELPDCSTPRLIVLSTAHTAPDLHQRFRQSQPTRLLSEVRNYARAFSPAQAPNPTFEGFCCSDFKRRFAQTLAISGFQNIF